VWDENVAFGGEKARQGADDRLPGVAPYNRKCPREGGASYFGPKGRMQGSSETVRNEGTGREKGGPEKFFAGSQVLALEEGKAWRRGQEGLGEKENSFNLEKQPTRIFVSGGRGGDHATAAGAPPGPDRADGKCEKKKRKRSPQKVTSTFTPTLKRNH